jgi:hypothetical protein
MTTNIGTTKTMTHQTVTADLRSQLGSLEGRQVELIAERDEISYSALVEKEKTAAQRLAQINQEIEANK